MRMLTTVMDGETLYRADEVRRARFAVVTDKHRRVLHAVAMRCCARDAATADDLVQDSLERAWRKLELLHDDDKALPWLIRILHNCWIDACRRRRKDVPMAEVPDQIVPEEEAPRWQQVTADDFHRAIDQLVEPYRSVVIMHDIDQLSNAAIAERLGTPYQTVATRLHRGHKQVRALLKIALDGKEK